MVGYQEKVTDNPKMPYDKIFGLYLQRGSTAASITRQAFKILDGFQLCGVV